MRPRLLIVIRLKYPSGENVIVHLLGIKALLDFSQRNRIHPEGPAPVFLDLNIDDGNEHDDHTAFVLRVHASVRAAGVAYLSTGVVRPASHREYFY